MAKEPGGEKIYPSEGRGYLEHMIQEKEIEVMHHQQIIEELEKELIELRGDLEKLELENP